MPKHEALTPKAIANRIKAKGLQKLRWYCQMCQKQCRDENGFKCHTMSESHQRQLLLFADNPHKYLDSFSQEFETDFLHLLSRRFGTRRVSANQVYQEYISDRNHLHMNSTKWETLTGFVKWLGRDGKCLVDQTEKGWFITYIDRDPETIRRQESLAKKERMEKDDDERMAEFISKQVERAKSQSKTDTEPQYSRLQRDSDEKVVFKLPLPKPAEKPIEVPPVAKTKMSSAASVTNKPASETPKAEKRKVSALDEIMAEQEMSKEKMNRKDHWITEGIVVKILTKSLGDKYHKSKAVVKEVHGKYVAIVQVLDGGDLLKLDQAHLETVIPARGRPVKVVNGAYRGCEAILEELDQDNFCCTIKIRSGTLKGRVVEGVQYEDISKLNVQS